MKEKKETLVVIHKSPRVLLGMKKERFGKGKYNGFGGGLEPQDQGSLEACAMRETQEEAKITPTDLQFHGKIRFRFLDRDEPDHLVHFYRATKYTGTITETDEMKPRWFNENNIPYEQMWVDDKFWLPLMLEGQEFQGHFNFRKNGEIESYRLNGISGGGRL